MTRREAPVSPPVVLTIAGSDSGGGAGIQADLKTIEACGGFGTSAITSVTAQNTQGVQGSQLLPIEDIDAQVEAVLSDFDVAAVKTGMLATSDVVDLVADHAAAFETLVVDPVMVAASGDRLLAEEAEDAYEDLVAEATLVTPNADEAEVLTGVAVEDPAAAERAGRVLVDDHRADAALVKGGHVPGDRVVDTLVTADGVATFRHDRVATDATHGSGCTLSSAIATRLAHGDDLQAAVGAGIDLLARAVRYNVAVGEGPGAVHHLAELRNDASRQPTVDLIATVADRLRAGDLATLEPDDGFGLVGATPHAEEPADVAGLAGRHREMTSVNGRHGIGFGADDALASVLLAAREADPALRFAALVATDEDATDGIDGSVHSVDALGDHVDGPGPVAGEVTAAMSDETAPAALVPDAASGDEDGERAIVFGETTTQLLDRLAAAAGQSRGT